ncbi:MAG: beta-lactamase family protein [Gammaproteobacteria bacterium]|nr:beta-lactamase family protein [Gammaproteobacteria bacterium]MYH84991.1 beta-lactamase family protein [Gammaproteobacteria bacterium]MYK03892.1 beta-lactamase family protein [Gammaproteobacteria bacterium]
MLITSKARSFCALLAIFLSTTCRTADSGNIHERINSAVSRGDVGAAVFASYDQGDVTIYGYGQINPEQSQEPNGDTLFEVGSITKLFTAILAQRMVEHGRLDWDEPISSHFKELSFENESVGAITLRSLATHSSGLPRLPENFFPGDSLNPYADYTSSDLSAFLSSYDPDSLPNEYGYSNLGFGLLGAIAADAAQMDYPAAVKEYILAPLNMNRSSAAYPQQVDPNTASGYSNGATMPAWTFDALAGAGAIVSSANDLMRFIRASFEADAFGVHAATVATQQRQEGHSMALAWHMSSDSDGNTIHWHNGGTGGYASFLAVNSTQSKGWLILTASTDYAGVTELGMSLLAQPSPSRMGANP